MPGFAHRAACGQPPDCVYMCTLPHNQAMQPAPGDTFWLRQAIGMTGFEPELSASKNRRFTGPLVRGGAGLGLCTCRGQMSLWRVLPMAMATRTTSEAASPAAHEQVALERTVVPFRKSEHRAFRHGAPSWWLGRQGHFAREGASVNHKRMPLGDQPYAKPPQSTDSVGDARAAAATYGACSH